MKTAPALQRKPRTNPRLVASAAVRARLAQFTCAAVRAAPAPAPASRWQTSQTFGMSCPRAASLSQDCAHASRSCSSHSTRTARSRPSRCWVQRRASQILTPTTFLQQQRICGFKRCRRVCTGASLGGGLSPPAVRVLPGQIRPHCRRKRVPNRRYKNSRRRRRRKVPNRRHKNGKAPGERVCRERVQQGSRPLHRSCPPAAAPLTQEKRYHRNRRVTISIGPPLQCGCVGECKSSQGVRCHSSFGLQESIVALLHGH